MFDYLRYNPCWNEHTLARTGWGEFPRPTVIAYRFEFVGVAPLPAPVNVYRDQPIAVGTVELYQGARFLVASVDESVTPPVAVLRKVRA